MDPESTGGEIVMKYWVQHGDRLPIENQHSILDNNLSNLMEVKESLHSIKFNVSRRLVWTEHSQRL